MKCSEKHLHVGAMKEVKKFRELHKEFVICTNLVELLRLEATIGWACSLDGDKFIYIFGRKI
jgi:hypothetical protein